MTGLVNSIGSLGSGGASVVPSNPNVYGPMQPSKPTSYLSSLSTGLNLASAGALIFSSNQQAGAEMTDATQKAQADTFQSQDAELEAKREYVRGSQQATQIMDSLRQTIAGQGVAFAANGMDIGFGTPVAKAASATKFANAQLATNNFDTLTNVLARRKQAAALQEQAANTLTSGAATAKNTRLKGVIAAGGVGIEALQRSIDRG